MFLFSLLVPDYSKYYKDNDRKLDLQKMQSIQGYLSKFKSNINFQLTMNHEYVGTIGIDKSLNPNTVKKLKSNCNCDYEFIPESKIALFTFKKTRTYGFVFYLLRIVYVFILIYIYYLASKLFFFDKQQQV